METQKTQQTTLSVASSDPLIGTMVGDRYRILSKVDSGGLSDVYRACEIASVRTVALKIIRISNNTGKSGFEMFTSNARLTVQHPNLVTMHACGLTEDGEPWLALEWLEGRTLANLLASDCTLPLDTIKNIFQQLANVLTYVHGKGEVHINLKPSNVFIVQRNGQPFIKLCDFGFAKMLIERELEMADEKGPATGSSLYMSPEQFQGTRIDSRTDIYAAGCILYECLFGRPPHQGTDLLETMDRHMNAEVSFPATPEVSEQMQAVLSKMLEKDSARRHRMLQDVLVDIERALNGEFPKEEVLPRPLDDSRGLDFLSVKRGLSAPKGREPWMLLMGCVTVLLFVLIFQQCMSMMRESQNHALQLQKTRYEPGSD